jgi:malonate-semialdehyde dehydrogenase (acetylating)/methylmalonate-semialdehyde dehydrogenase
MALLPEVQSHYGRLKLLINGEWVESDSNDIQQTTNPATGEVIADYPLATQEEGEQAVAAAATAFQSWKNVCLRDRARMLFDLRSRLEEQFEELCRVLTQDHGRTISESRGSMRRVIENVESACSATYGLVKMNEYVDELAGGIDQSLVWEPCGPFLIVTPGNIPMHAWSSFVPYAIGAGCTVVVSPSHHAPVAADAITRVAQEVFPPGVINFVHGDTPLKQTMLHHSDIKGIGFIGSSAVGRELHRVCGELGKPSSLNGNGKNHVIIMPDADLDQTAQLLVSSCFAMGGQRCLGSDNIVIVGDRHDELKEKLVMAAELKLGYGMDESTTLGPMCTHDGKEKVLSWIDRALGDGATMVKDGRNAKVAGYEKGYFLGPTILENYDTSMATAKEESFGPVAALMRASSIDEVLEWINGQDEHGHSACIFTQSGKIARNFVREAEVGNVGINVAIPQPFAFFPLGSKKQSFLGSAKSRMSSMRLFLDEKTVTTRWS